MADSELVKSINNLTLRMETFIARQEEMCKESCDQRKEIQDTLYNSTTGLCVRTQSLESSMGPIKIFLVLALGAAITLVAEDVYSSVVKKNNQLPVPTKVEEVRK